MDKQAEDAAVKAAEDIIRILDKMQASIRQMRENNKRFQETRELIKLPKTVTPLEE